jgi:hypothetical protein
MALDEKSRMRQFWLRVLLALGILWGGMPLLTLPLVFMGVVPAPFGLFVALVNGLTVAPACTLAFWHRLSACIWVSVNAVICLITVTSALRTAGHVDITSVIALAGSVVIALCLDFIEIRRWPPALGPVDPASPFA